ncbi:hypothetical protein SmJEL517_g01062 [Synchytrium microbalum]|uniref:Aspartate-semialdehyde dehydrogenase n=1 Tax=Synchytrium microbalum TaxID=1806994 RepID=A0A507CCV7_9FUNG|nr:uncharacterized protein SmJEL517_g01062 [Synchytrium microbalum]TPX37009.1 hypothetical protein SmJEL517_g01062 [Synchytrium microbalum]
MSEPARKKQRNGASSATATQPAEPTEKINVGILGATGMVGQRFMQLLSTHPYFIVTHLGASSRSAGKTYTQATAWKQSTPIPSIYASMLVTECKPDLFPGVKIVFSGLDSDVAGDVEDAFLAADVAVFSNAKNHRMDDDVPLVVPVVNTRHYDIIGHQRKHRGVKKGLLVANANCSTTGLVVPLKALEDAFGGLDKVMVVTMQAVSGAGYPGVASMDILDNVVPYISGEEEKMEIETSKILGSLNKGKTAFINNKVVTSASCNRVPVIDGHTESVSVLFSRKPAPSVADVISALKAYTCEAQSLNCPSAPEQVIIVHEAPDRPQPRLDRDNGRGMAVTVGRVRECPIFDVKFTLLSHNTILGAAGSSIMNAEVAVAKGLIK